MNLCVITGGLYERPTALGDDIVGPDKPISEWTPEEHEAYFLELWNDPDEGGIEHAVKSLQLPQDEIRAAIHILESIRDRFKSESDRLGLTMERWETQAADHILLCLRHMIA